MTDTMAGAVGAGPDEGHQRDGAPLLWSQAGRDAVVQPGEEKAERRPKATYHPIPTKELVRGFPQE